MPSLWTLCVNQFFFIYFFFIVGRFLSVMESFLSKSSAVCSILIQTSDHIYSSHNKHITFGLLVLVRHTCLSVCHLSSLTSTFPSCSLLFAANALMSQSDSNSRVCVCFNVCTRLSFPCLAGFLSFPWWETRVPKEPANVKSQSRLTENLLGNVCVCAFMCVKQSSQVPQSGLQFFCFPIKHLFHLPYDLSTQSYAPLLPQCVLPCR